MKTTIRTPIAVLAVLISVLTLASIVTATALGPTPFINTSGAGLTLADGGAGIGGDSGRFLPQTISVTINGSASPASIQQAWLYWAGFDSYPGTPNDQNLAFDGNAISGTLVGTEVLTDTQANLISQAYGYRADVTSIVQGAYGGPGTYNFVVDDDGNAGNNALTLEGAGLLVLYTNPNDTAQYRVIVYDGIDYAFDVARFADPANRVTDPVTFNYASASVDRTAELIVFGGAGQPSRGDRLDITANSSLFDIFNHSDGPRWNTDLFNITVPTGAASTTVQAVSVDPNRDSFIWELVALRLQTTTSTAITLSSLSATTTATNLLPISLLLLGGITVGTLIFWRRR